MTGADPLSRRLILIGGGAMLLDMLFFAVVVPLLPTLADEFDLSKLSAGILTGSYAAGVLVGALPGALLAVRYGPRAVLLVGLVMLASTSVVFGFGHSIVVLDLARFAQGVGGAWTWGGAMTWILMVAPADRRGAAIGQTLALGVSGTVLGPIVGAIAESTSRQLVFCCIVGAALALAFVAAQMPGPAGSPGAGLTGLGDVVRSRAVRAAAVVVAVPAVAVGANNVLGALRLDHLGASTAIVGGTFTVAAALQALASPRVGRIADRRGFAVVLRLGLPIGAVLIALSTLPQAIVPCAIAVVVVVVVFGVLNIPSIGLLNALVESCGASPALSFAAANIGWAVGQAVGSAGGGALANTTTDAVPLLAVAAMAVITRQVILRLTHSSPEPKVTCG